MGQAAKPHDRLTGGTLVALSKAAFHLRIKKRNSWEGKLDGITDVDFAPALLGVCQRILDHYFLHISDHEAASLNEEVMVNNQHRFISLIDDGTKDSTRLNHAAALIAQLDTRHSPVGFDDIYVTNNINADQCRAAFKTIFVVLGQAQHYNMIVPEETAQCNQSAFFPELMSSDESTKIKGYGGKK